MEELLALLGLGGGGLLVGDAYDKLGDAGDTAWTQSQRIGDEANQLSDFQGYGVTGPTGTTSVDSAGNTMMDLNHDQQKVMNRFNHLGLETSGDNHPLAQFGNSALGTGQGMMQNLQQGYGGYGQDAYDKIRAMQQPEEQRQQLALESRLASQGRTGVSTAAYGGTPEALTLQKAIQEGQNSAAVQALGMGQEQQGLDQRGATMMGQAGQGALGAQGDLSNLYTMLQYAPQSAALDMFGAGSNAFGYEDIANRQGANQFSEANMGGLEALLGSRLGQGNLSGQLGTAAISGGFGMLQGMAGPGGGGFSLDDLLSQLGLGS